MITLKSARKYEELLTGDVEPAPYDYATLFKAEGFLPGGRTGSDWPSCRGLTPSCGASCARTKGSIS